MEYRFTVSLWGPDYARSFCEISLPSQLAPGNLPSVAAAFPVAYRIYTDAATRPLLETHDSVERLRAFASVEIADVADVAFGARTIAAQANELPASAQKHELQSLCYMHALDGAATDGAVLFPLAADMVFSADALSHITGRLGAGKKAVLANFLRLTRETAEDVLAGALAAAPQGLTGRDLCAIAFEHLHPIQRAFDVGRGQISDYPVQLVWQATNGSLLVRGLFPHPIAVVPSKSTTRFDSTIDYDFAFHVAPSAEDIDLVRDSDKALVCRLSPRGHLADAHKLIAARPETVADHILRETNRRHLEFFEVPSLFHAVDPGEPELEAARRSVAFASAVVDALRARVEQGSSNPEDMMALKSFLGPIELYLSPQRRAVVDAVVKPDD